MNKKYIIVKTFLDKICASVLLVILIPVFIVIAILIKIESKGNILFKQERIGKDNKKFKMYKFRTMKQNTPKNVPTNKLENPQQYITKMGNILRKTSLDELPQLLNVINGDMSFIGPRPCLKEQEELVNLRGLVGANKVLPGITGLAQINGRDELEDYRKAELDAKYVRNLNFKMDIEILLKTILKVIKQENIVEGEK